MVEIFGLWEFRVMVPKATCWSYNKEFYKSLKPLPCLSGKVLTFAHSYTTLSLLFFHNRVLYYFVWGLLTANFEVLNLFCIF